MAINFDFRSGAKKSGHLDYPLQSYGPKQVRLISTQPWVAGKWVFRAPECSLKRGVNEVENKVANKVNIIKIKTGIRKGQSQ